MFSEVTIAGIYHYQLGAERLTISSSLNFSEPKPCFLNDYANWRNHKVQHYHP